MDLEWLIIGGGIHGAHLAARLLGDAGVGPERLRVIDPADRLLSRWRTCTATTGMDYLRSSAVHHIDLKPFSLQHFASSRNGRKSGLFEAPFDRPALDLFNDHCDRVIERFQLADLHIQARAQACTVDCESAAVQLSDGSELEAEHLVLAIGAAEQAAWPEWAPRNEPRVRHVFAPGFDSWPTAKETVIVVGGGISAGQIALRLLGEGHRVHLVSRHPLRQHLFDSDPGWLGPNQMTSFSRERDHDRRRSLITMARHRGSVTPSVWRRLRAATAGGGLGWHEARVEQLDVEAEGLAVRLSTDAVLGADRMLLATGFSPSRPGAKMLDDLVDSAGLPCARCGYPIVDSALRWHPRVHVTGPLAELELGPVSRNIAGARRAGDRLIDAVQG
ncbi:MAG: FAD/NAD(P)-binding protein [Acidobacteriota bacterium]